jgi:NADPH-dependent 2,4-dienoyl-CoA reductase/sulfur reductase-like enzyme/nitrite reductase/ring-hydroxylating ferredoxin subunit
MGSNHDGPTGPDLSQGVPQEQVSDGGILAGQVGGEAVLLTRRAGEWFAIGAACSHYSGPLPEGLIVGDTVRCPWHHACFSLRTGESLRPPGLHDVACYSVDVREGKVFVTGRKPKAARPSPRGVHPKSVVIIGGGAAGDSASATLRREGYDGPITIVDADGDAPYDRPNCSKDYLAGNAPEDWLPLRPADFERKQRIDRQRGKRATALDPSARRVQLDDGSTLDYGALLLATGASPIRLGKDVDSGGTPVYYLRSLADSRAIIAAAGAARRVAVLGASFIGLEVAASLRARDLEVHVIAPDPLPLNRVLGPELGRFVKALHEEHGVTFHLESKARSIGKGQITLENGSTVAADFVVAGIGVRPNLELAEAAGLKVDRGLEVSELLETSAPGVFAAGDIARWPDPHTGDRIRVEHWVLAQRQGQAAARNMLGYGEPFTAVPFFWSQHYDVPINYVGHAERWDRIEIEGNVAERDCAVRFVRGDRTLALATIYRDQESLQFEARQEGVLA